MLIEIFAFFAPFAIGGVLGVLGARRIRRVRWLMLVPAFGIVAAFAWVSSTAGYTGFARELLMCLFAAGALVLPMSIAMTEQGVAKTWSFSPRRSAQPLLAFLLLPLLVGVFMPWTARVNWARKMAWACDGVIVEKYRSNNHRAPTLLVQNRDGSRAHLEGVNTAAWDKAATQDHLRKVAGHADAQLNDQTVQLVLRNGW